MSINTVLFTLAGVGLASAQTTIKSSLAGGNEVYDGFVSFSIEFSSFPDFAGDLKPPLVVGLNPLRQRRQQLETEHILQHPP